MLLPQGLPRWQNQQSGPLAATQLFVAPQYQRQNLGRRLLAFTRQHLPNEIYLRCVRENEKAWRWYEREGFVFEKEEVEPMTGFVMKYYRWRQKGNTR